MLSESSVIPSLLLVTGTADPDPGPPSVIYMLCQFLAGGRHFNLLRKLQGPMLWMRRVKQMFRYIEFCPSAIRLHIHTTTQNKTKPTLKQTQFRNKLVVFTTQSHPS
jgi:hypothetical protein